MRKKWLRIKSELFCSPMIRGRASTVLLCEMHLDEGDEGDKKGTMLVAVKDSWAMIRFPESRRVESEAEHKAKEKSLSLV